MNEIIKVDKNELAEALQIWFSQFKNNNNAWQQDAVAKIIKDNLIRLKRWRVAGRGNPKAGGNKRVENKAKKEAEERARRLDW